MTDMVDKDKKRSLDSGTPADIAYDLPAYGSPQAKPAPAIREPESPTPSSRAPGRKKDPGIRLPGRRERLAPDDRLATPEAGEEYIDGVRIEVMAGGPEHADPQCQLSSVVRACVAPGYIASTELLTRTDIGSDFATDVCVRQVGTDPETGGHYLEELAFEIANTQTLRDLEEVRAPKLVACGVRRIFAVLVKKGEVLEWLPAGAGGWKKWTSGQEIHDPVFLQPLTVEAILDAAAADQLVAKALLAKREPYLMEVLEKREEEARSRGEARGRLEGLAEGEAKGLAEAILRVFKSHSITLDAENRQALLACRDTTLLRRWLDKALVADSASEILAELEQES